MSFVLENQPFWKCSSLYSQSKFVIGLFVFYTVPIFQIYGSGIHYCKTKETTSTLCTCTSGIYMKSEYLTSLQVYREADLKVRFVVLGFKKNANQQAQRHYHWILCMRTSQILLNSMHYFGHCLFMNAFKMHRTVCKQRRNDVNTDSAIMRCMHTRQCSHLMLGKFFRSYSELIPNLV